MADNIWTAAVEGIAARGRANNGAEGDYRDEEGFLCCGKCHTRKEGDIKSEYLLPQVIDRLVSEGKARVKVLETPDKWFGVTYKEDKQAVIDSLRALIASGAYPEKLYQ